MIDHLLRFTDRASAEAVWPDPNVGPCWRSDEGTVMPVRMIVARAVFDDEGAEISPEVAATGYWLAIRTEAPSDVIAAMPECMVITDSELAKTGGDYVHLSRIAPDTVLAQVDPTFAGDRYPFPPGATGQWLADHLIA